MTTVVVGGGVVGLCAAHYLRAAGEDVTVVETGALGAASSWGNAGWIVPSLAGPIPDRGVIGYVARSVASADSPVYLRPHAERGLLPWLWRFARSCTRTRHLDGLHATARLGARTMELFDGLRADGVVFDMWQEGLLFAALTSAAADEELRSMRTLESYGYRLPSDITGGCELAAHEPTLSDRVAAGFVVAEERHVDPGSLTAGLAASLRADGVTFIEQTTVSGFARRNGHVDAVRTNEGDVPADHVVVAAGAWSGHLAAALGTSLPMTAGKGYSFSLQPDTVPTRPIYLVEAKVGVTPFGPRVRIAGTMELTGFDARVDPRRLRAMGASAARYLAFSPSLVVGEPWAGLRPLTPDGLPVIGRAPGVDNAYLATGHAMLGVTLGPATGEALAGVIVRGENPAVLRPFDPARFA